MCAGLHSTKRSPPAGPSGSRLGGRTPHPRVAGGQVAGAAGRQVDKATTAQLDYSGATFSGGTVNFSGAEFSGGTVNFGVAMFSGGTVNFFRATFSGGTVNFFGAEFSGGTVNFGVAMFSGGTVDLSSPEDWSVPPSHLPPSPPGSCCRKDAAGCRTKGISSVGTALHEL
jgi:hypothetical protein